jgi:hypothetical protein
MNNNLTTLEQLALHCGDFATLQELAIPYPELVLQNPALELHLHMGKKLSIHALYRLLTCRPRTQIPQWFRDFAKEDPLMNEGL